MNDDTNNPAAKNDSDASAVLDTSGEGGPVISPSISTDPSAPPPLPPPPTEEFMIEVELAAGVEDDIDALVSRINAPDAAGGGDPSSQQESELGRVARPHGLIEARPVFTREQRERDEARISALRDASGGAPEGVSPQGAELDQLPPLSRFVRLRFPPGTNVAALLRELNALPQVKRAVFVPRAAPPAVPTDPMIGNDGSSVTPDANGVEPQWYLHRTRVKQAWEIALGLEVVIADVDWGCLTTHRELVGAIERTYNAVDGSTDVTHGPKRPHGTAVLGLAGGRADGQGLAGYAPKSALWAIQGDSGVGPAQFAEPWVEAIDYVVRTSAGARRKVIIVEVQTEYYGNYEQIPSFHRAVKAAIAANCVVCVAAGNGNRRADQDDYNNPFDPTGSILVGATFFHPTLDLRADFSNYGPTVDVCAPGGRKHDVTCGEFKNGVVVNNAYRNNFGGTSGATAKVAGAAALVLSTNSNLSHHEVRDILKTTGSSINPDEPIGKFLNTEAAVLEARRRL